MAREKSDTFDEKKARILEFCSFSQKVLEGFFINLEWFHRWFQYLIDGGPS